MSTDTPTGWIRTALGSLLREPLRNGHSAKATGDGSGIRTLTLTAVTAGDFSESNTKLTCADRAKVADLWLQPGDLLIERANTPELVGTARVYRGQPDWAIFPDLLIRARLRTEVSDRFVEFFLHSEEARDHFRRSAQGIAGSMPKIDQGAIERLSIPLAPRAEQERIVEETEKQFTRLDAGVNALKRLQAHLKRYRASVLKAACEGRLVPTEAELARKERRDYEPADKLLERILKERRAKWEADQLAKMKAAGKLPKDDRWKAKYKEPPPAKIDELPLLPEGWVWASVEAISTKVVDGVHKTPSYLEEGIPFVTVRNLTAGPGIDLEELNYVAAKDHAEFVKRANPQRGDLLISKDGTLGVVRAIRTDRQFSIFVSVALVKPVDTTLTDYLELALSSPQVQRQMVPKGTGLVHLHLEDLREDCIPLPPLPEQARIVAEASRVMSSAGKVGSLVDASLRRGSRLRQSVLRFAFEGKLVDQNPADEPASVLLERVRASATEPPGRSPKGRSSKSKPKAPVAA